VRDKRLKCLSLVTLESELILRLNQGPVDALQDPLHYRLLFILLLLAEGRLVGWSAGGILLGFQCIHQTV
jgi:hypothetical protein